MRYQLFTGAVALVLVSLAINCSAQKNAEMLVSAQTYGNVAEIGKLSESRASHSATVLSNGMVLIAGGMERNGVFFDDADIFDPNTNAFRQARGKMTVKRVSHTATHLPDGRVLIVGGWSTREVPEMSAEIYDPRTETFKPLGNTGFRRSAHTATVLKNGKVLIAGGFDGKGSLSEAELFDPRTNTFTTIGKSQKASFSNALSGINRSCG